MSDPSCADTVQTQSKAPLPCSSSEGDLIMFVQQQVEPASGGNDLRGMRNLGIQTKKALIHDTMVLGTATME